MTSFAMLRYKYRQLDASVDSFESNTGKTIIVIFCFTIIVISKFQYHPSLLNSHK